MAKERRRISWLYDVSSHLEIMKIPGELGSKRSFEGILCDNIKFYMTFVIWNYYQWGVVGSLLFVNLRNDKNACVLIIYSALVNHFIYLSPWIQK